MSCFKLAISFLFISLLLRDNQEHRLQDREPVAKGGILINTARKEVINEPELLEASRRRVRI